ncbi:MAG: cupin domain-containing protein [Pseudomonadota bacterium]
MEVFRSGDRPTVLANPEYFSGTVYQNPIIQAPDPARVRALHVSFLPGGRTAWHTHPLGQTLFVLSGVGLLQKKGEAIQQIRAGDTVWIAPDEVHWHGATPDQAMVHIAIQEALDGSNVTWMQHVTDEEYAA